MSKYNIRKNVTEFRKNSKTIKGSFKNGFEASKAAPTLFSKIFVFLGVAIIPILITAIFFLFIVMMLVSMAGVIIVNNPEIGFNPLGDKEDGSDNNREVSDYVPDSVRGKLLLSWNADFTTRGQSGRTHRGIDFQPIGKKVYADDLAMYPVYPGTVEEIQEYNAKSVTSCSNKSPKITLDCSYGNAVVLEINLDGKNYYILYAHLDKIYVKKGDKVDWFTRLGKMGCTGSSFGSWHGCGTHLHLEILTDKYKQVGVSSKALVTNMEDFFACGTKPFVAGFSKSNPHCTEYRNKVLGKDQFGKPH